MAWWVWLLIGAAAGAAVSFVAWALMMPMLCDAYFAVEIGALAADPATRDMTVRELRTERERSKGGK